MRCIGNHRSFGQNVFDPANNPDNCDVADSYGKVKEFQTVSLHRFSNNLNDRLTSEQFPAKSPDYYFSQCDYYFNSLESKFHWHRPKYSKDIIRWEWTPWLMLTGMGRTNITTIDSLIRLCPCIVINRSYRYFPKQPFVRALVTIYYGDEVIRRGQPLRIYEEFTFNDNGEISFIEAWWAREGDQLPLLDSDGWPVEPCINRLSTRLPGLGSSPYGTIDLDSDSMLLATRQDMDVNDFRRRCKKFYSSVVQELVNDMIKNRETILGMRIRKRTNSFIFRTNSFSSTTNPSRNNKFGAIGSFGERESGLSVGDSGIDFEDEAKEIEYRSTFSSRAVFQEEEMKVEQNTEENREIGKISIDEEDDMCTYRFDESFGDYLPLRPTDG